MWSNALDVNWATEAFVRLSDVKQLTLYVAVPRSSSRTGTLRPAPPHPRHPHPAALCIAGRRESVSVSRSGTSSLRPTTSMRASRSQQAVREPSPGVQVFSPSAEKT